MWYGVDWSTPTETTADTVKAATIQVEPRSTAL